MDNRYFMEGEEVITRSNGNIITLTNLRLRYADSEWGKAHIVSLLLEKICSIEIHYRSNLLFLVLAVAAGIGGVLGVAAGGNANILGIGAVVAVAFFLAWLFSKRHYLTIASCGGAKIHFHTKGMRREALLDFINETETAIKQRREALK